MENGRQVNAEAGDGDLSVMTFASNDRNILIIAFARDLINNSMLLVYMP